MIFFLYTHKLTASHGFENTGSSRILSSNNLNDNTSNNKPNLIFDPPIPDDNVHREIEDNEFLRNHINPFPKYDIKDSLILPKPYNYNRLRDNTYFEQELYLGKPCIENQSLRNKYIHKSKHNNKENLDFIPSLGHTKDSIKLATTEPLLSMCSSLYNGHPSHVKYMKEKKNPMMEFTDDNESYYFLPKGTAQERDDNIYKLQTDRLNQIFLRNQQQQQQGIKGTMPTEEKKEEPDDEEDSGKGKKGKGKKNKKNKGGKKSKKDDKKSKKKNKKEDKKSKKKSKKDDKKSKKKSKKDDKKSKSKKGKGKKGKKGKEEEEEEQKEEPIEKAPDAPTDQNQLPVQFVPPVMPQLNKELPQTWSKSLGPLLPSLHPWPTYKRYSYNNFFF